MSDASTTGGRRTLQGMPIIKHIPRSEDGGAVLLPPTALALVTDAKCQR